MQENGALVPMDRNNAEIFDVGRARRVLRKQGVLLVRKCLSYGEPEQRGSGGDQRGVEAPIQRFSGFRDAGLEPLPH
jgi:hypothetical protein